jgi:hypothetical protein
MESGGTIDTINRPVRYKKYFTVKYFGYMM